MPEAYNFRIKELVLNKDQKISAKSINIFISSCQIRIRRNNFFFIIYNITVIKNLQYIYVSHLFRTVRDAVSMVGVRPVFWMSLWHRRNKR